ncbi:MAG: nitrate reductase molybdenum cofactor assembly chaperone [Micavibrio sp.]
MKSHITGQTLKIIGFLMTYPEDDRVDAAAEIRTLLGREAWLSEKMRARLDEFLAGMKDSDLLDLQEEYVMLFDRTPSLSLHLFEHVHGDSRDRGQAMVDLDTLYREAGLANMSEHTPDFLPLFLEYISLLPVERAQENLDGAIDVVATIGERLKKRQSRYAVLFDALLEAARARPDEKKLKAAMTMDSGLLPDTAQMDAVWEEQFALAAPQVGQSGCPRAEDMLARMMTPEEKSEARS